MTLKEKFDNLDYFDSSDIINNLSHDSHECEKIADEFAIAFTDWCEDHYYPSSTTGIWFDKPDFDNAKQLLTKELLKIYKEKKGL
jgi:hypothetical protein